MTINPRRIHKIVLVTFLLSLLTSCTPQRAPQTSFTFAFLTDIHVQPERNGEEGFLAAIDKVNDLQPDFVITGGDLVYDALDETWGRADSLYNMYIEDCRSFNMPVYNTFGNHETFGVYERSGIDPDHPDYNREMFEKRLGEGETYRSFDYKGWHFILLNGVGITEDRDYVGEVDSTQLAWLADDLARVGPQTPIVVSIHIPLASVFPQFKYGTLEPMHEKAMVANNREVIKAFDEYNLKLVLQGHLHCVEEIIYKDVHYITGGAVSANWWRGPRDGFEEGFVLVKVTGDDFTWEYIDYGWEVEETE